MQLQEIKEAYMRCCQSKNDHARLHQKRDAVEQKILELDKLLENAAYSQNKFEQEYALRVELKNELKSLDHALDMIGDNPEEEAEKLKQNLISSIQELHPESTPFLEKLKEKLTACQRNEAECRDEIEILRPFESALEEGAYSRNGGKLSGLLFGRNRKAMLARAIQKGMDEGERIHKKVKNKKLHYFISKFLEEANQPWHGELYRERFYQFYDEFKALMKELDEEIDQSRNEARNIEKEIDAWIEKYL